MSEAESEKEEKVKSDLENEEKTIKKEEEKINKIEENKENIENEESKDNKENKTKKDNKEQKKNENDDNSSNKNEEQNNKESESHSESSKSNNDNESNSDKNESEDDEGEGEDDDLDDDEDEDDDVDDDKSNESDSDNKKKKDPYHAYINSKLDLFFDCFDNLSKGEYIFGLEKNKYYKILDINRNSNSNKFEMEIELIDNATIKTKKDKLDMKKISDNILFKQLTSRKINKEEKENINENNKEKDENKKNEIDIKNKEDNCKDNKDKDNENNKKDKVEEEKKDNKENNKVDKNENSKEKDEKEENKEKEKTKNPKKNEEDSKKDKQKKGNKKKVTETITIKDYSKYTSHQKINIFYINYLNIFHRIDMIIDINGSIDDIINTFKKLYHIPIDRYSEEKPPLNIFINGKKYSIANKARKRFFTPNKFDYKNDYIIILEKEVFKIKEIDIGSRSNYINLKGAKIAHYVYSSYYNLQVDSFIISKNLNSLECEVYELRKEFHFDIDLENEKGTKKKVKEFLDLNWKEKSNFISLIKSDNMRKSKENYNANCFEINRKFILHQGIIYIFVITASNKKLEAFNSRHISNEGLVIISKDDRSLLSGFKAKKISDLVAY